MYVLMELMDNVNGFLANVLFIQVAVVMQVKVMLFANSFHQIVHQMAQHALELIYVLIIQSRRPVNLDLMEIVFGGQVWLFAKGFCHAMIYLT